MEPFVRAEPTLPRDLKRQLNFLEASTGSFVGLERAEPGNSRRSRDLNHS